MSLRWGTRQRRSRPMISRDRPRKGSLLVLRRFVQLLFTVLALGVASSAGATPPGANGRIAYSSSRDGNPELYSIALDGSSERRLTWTSATAQHPAWSPDGTKIAYEHATLGGSFRIWVMNADGSSPTQISPEP